MYIKLKNGKIDKYPYSLEQLVADNPNTSFPAVISDALAEEFDVYPVVPAEVPSVDHTKTIVEETPNLTNGVWYQDIKVVDATEEEIAYRVQELNGLAQQNRANAYRNESDPLFFKWQRGEATEQEWLDKVNEIKQRYQYIL
jgi:hypothetical protein